ncbi:MAG: branched-chain amino acid ABC transporter permease [Actinomycetota bacterium]
MTKRVVGTINHPVSRRRAVRVLLGLFVALGAMLATPGVSAAEDLSIQVQVKDQRRDASGKTDNQPVAGVLVTVFDAAGVEIASMVTNEKGIALIVVPEKADYLVRIDETTLPEGLALSAETPAEQPVTTDSFVTSKRIVNFFTGESQSEELSNTERIAQRFADGIRLGLIIAMCSVGLSLIFGTTGLTNFAHGEMVTFGAMVAYFFNDRGIHILLAAPIAIAAGGLFGYSADRFGFAKFRARGIGLISQMVITLGMSIDLKNMFLWRFGGRDKPFLDYTNQVGSKIGPITITQRDLIVTILAVIVLVSVALVLQYTRLGKATRAVSDNIDLASSTGIDSAKVIRYIWIVGGALTAMGGVFRGLDEQVSWDMGTSLLFLMFAGITLGGLGSAYGALVGGFVVGVLVETSTLVGVPTELKRSPALLILILILLVRPQGILGRAQRVG